MPSSKSVAPVQVPSPAAGFVRGGSAANRVLAMTTADTKNDSAFTRNAVSRPNTAVTMPPTLAPMASMADQVALESAFAVSS